MDVYENEGLLLFEDRPSAIVPDDVFARLTTFPNVVITGNQWFLTREALRNIAEIILANVSDFDAGKLEPQNFVRLSD